MFSSIAALGMRLGSVAPFGSFRGENANSIENVTIVSDPETYCPCLKLTSAYVLIGIMQKLFALKWHTPPY